ncbi:DUF4861 domain-containing protein [Echinicola marina]|uniref:DUF4861 domain-containing protein n=1 Tax=Echinicola marina TaxID=2859768 RepID=UPI001CF680A9|nr:DUF4861 domain-containing protein [Echinicola marina]UCS91794.1 DUF4861 domain-containing protein [Echinicola marina]
MIDNISLPFLSKTSKSKKGWMVFSGVVSLLCLSSCNSGSGDFPKIEVSNPSDLARKSATIELEAGQFEALIKQYGTDQLVVEDLETGSSLVSQWIDLDGDKKMDQYLFQTDLEAAETKSFMLRPLAEGEQQPETEIKTFSRFVPERTDDYTWENDKVAFRTYGPDAQRRIEQKLPDGTLSSGIDAWLKRVNYPIIDKWYKENDEKKGAYHQDTGEGYDPYHVGSSRGIGGVGIWAEDSLYTSRNFISYKRIAVGPIRTMFELKYAPWEANGQMVSETKRVSLDLGSNLCRFESSFISEGELENITVGITLHDKKGEVLIMEEDGIMRYYEPIDGSMLGLGVIMDPKNVNEILDHRVEYKDGSQLLMVAKPKDQSVSYFAGFGWDKSGQFDNSADWDHYLQQFAKALKSPLKVMVQ